MTLNFQDQHQYGGPLSPKLIDQLTELASGAGSQGPPGPKGDTGATGPPGAAGPGVPTGGTTGQVAQKASNTDYDVTWHTMVKADVGLGSVDNTADTAKPVSTAQQTAIDLKVTANGAITGGTKTKITFDTKGLVTTGADATTADIADSTDRRYVTDAQRTVITNTSGTNTGDQTLGGLGGVSTTRALIIGGLSQDLSADRTWDLVATNGVPSIDETIAANFGVVILEEYVMDATHELIFSDPSEMLVA